MTEQEKIRNDVTMLRQLYREFLAVDPEISVIDVAGKELALKLTSRWKIESRMLEQQFKGVIEPNSNGANYENSSAAIDACQNYCRDQMERLPGELCKTIDMDTTVCLEQDEIIIPGNWEIFQYYPECETCGASGSVPCPACAGKDVQACNQCHGSGTQVCKVCNGHGRNTVVFYPEFYATNELQIDWERDHAPRWFYGVAAGNYEFAKHLENDISGGLEFVGNEAELTFSATAALVFEQIKIDVDRPRRSYNIAVERSTDRYTLNAIGDHESKLMLSDFVKGNLDIAGIEKLKDVPLFNDWFQKSEPLWRKARTLNFVSSDIEQWLKTGLQIVAKSLADRRKTLFWKKLRAWTPITIAVFFLYGIVINALYPELNWNDGPSISALFNPMFAWSHFYQQMIAVGDDCARYGSNVVCLNKWSMLHLSAFTLVTLLLSPYRFGNIRKYAVALLVATPVAGIFVGLESVFLQIIHQAAAPKTAVLTDPVNMLAAFQRTLPALGIIAFIGAWYSIASSSRRSRVFVRKQLYRLNMPRLRDYISA